MRTVEPGETGETQIREAYANKDSQLSQSAHEARRLLAAEERHASADAGDLIKSLVFGGLDGVITTFAIVAAVAGARMERRTVVLMGAANLVADSISMGLGDYLSEVAERRFVRHEFEREQWEMDNYPEGEIEEMIDIYVKRKGFSQQDASLVMRTMAKYPKAFVELMCVDELGFMAPNDEGDCPAWKKGLVTMLAFDVFGSIPILVYYLATFVHFDAADDYLFAISALSTAFTLFALGVTKASLTNQPRLSAGVLMLANGSLAAFAAYFVGYLIEAAYTGEMNPYCRPGGVASDIATGS